MSDDHIFTADFKARPYWWDAAQPGIGAPENLPGKVDVCIIGGGYTGLSCALELARSGVDCAVLDTKRIGQGASSRNGGLVSGGLKMAQKGLAGKLGEDRATRLLREATQTLAFIDDLILREEIDCDFARVGRFNCAWTPAHYDKMARGAETTEKLTGKPVYMVPRDRQREEIGSDHYFGGQVSEAAATIHPAKYVRGLADAAARAGATLVGQTRMTRMSRGPDGWTVETDRGMIRADRVMMGTNGYTGRETPWLRRRVVPVASFIIATEEIPVDLARELIPKARGLADTRRVLNYFRLSPDRRRVLWGGRVGTAAMDPRESARRLRHAMTTVWPQLEGTRISHSWNGNVAFTFDYLPHLGEHEGVAYALGCQGNGVAMQTWMGYQAARMMIGGNSESAFSEQEFPAVSGYDGTPWMLPAVLAWYRMRDYIERSRS